MGSVFFLASWITVAVIVESDCAHLQLMAGGGFFHDVVAYFLAFGFSSRGQGRCHKQC